MNRIELIENGNIYCYDPDDHTSTIKVSGKFNAVHQGYNKKNHSPVIIKKLNENLSNNIQAIEQFKKEFYFNVSHPNLVQTIAYLFQNGSHYIVREYTEGIDLKALSSSKRIKTANIIKYAIDILDALVTLHNNGIIHCDIRPANIIVDEKTNHAKLTDLGLAKRKKEFTGRSPFALIYSPPEQLLNISELVNESSDLYALGISLYELLSGELPFYHTNPELLMNLQLTQSLDKNRKIPQALFKVIKKATNKYQFPLPPKYFNSEILAELLYEAQKQRYQTAGEMKATLLKIEENLPKKILFWKFL